MRARAMLVTVATAVAAGSCRDMFHEVAAPPRVGGVDSLAVASNTGTADGVSLNRITVLLNAALPTKSRILTLKTTVGVFTLGGKQELTSLVPDSTRHASAFLQAPRVPGTAYITAYVGDPPIGPALVDTVAYAAATADSIRVIPDSLTISDTSGSVTKVTARLLRNTGMPSPGRRVTFDAIDSATGHPRGRWTPAPPPSDSSGIVVAWFTPVGAPGDTLHGVVILRATCDSAQGEARIRVR